MIFCIILDIYFFYDIARKDFFPLFYIDLRCNARTHYLLVCSFISLLLSLFLVCLSLHCMTLSSLYVSLFPFYLSLPCLSLASYFISLFIVYLPLQCIYLSLLLLNMRSDSLSSQRYLCVICIYIFLIIIMILFQICAFFPLFSFSCYRVILWTNSTRSFVSHSS